MTLPDFDAICIQAFPRNARNPFWKAIAARSSSSAVSRSGSAKTTRRLPPPSGRFTAIAERTPLFVGSVVGEDVQESGIRAVAHRQTVSQRSSVPISGVRGCPMSELLFKAILCENFYHWSVAEIKISACPIADTIPITLRAILSDRHDGASFSQRLARERSPTPRWNRSAKPIGCRFTVTFDLEPSVRKKPMI